ncbi:MAG TPA: heavy metal translocating P-type ATPase [Dissulfurispiraceae bacterium]|nr:heavy metal translocating P-type ATPase [Dissulfurispiraceae bacterium]
MKCDHCLLEFPDREAVYGEIATVRKVFCCHGCLGIAKLIHEEGLDKFYEKRTWKDAGISQEVFTAHIDSRPFDAHVRDTNGAKEIDIYIDGIRCASCVWLNERVLAKTKGIAYVRVNYATNMARIRWDPSVLGVETILERIRAVGYSPKPFTESEGFKARKSETKDLLLRFGTAAFLSSQLMIYSIALYAGYFQGIDQQTKLILEIIALCLTLPVILYSGMPLIISTINGIRRFRFNMDSLIVLGSGSAFIYSIWQILQNGEVYFDTAAMIITLILLGRYIEAAAKGKASESIEKLRELSPREARVLMQSENRQVLDRCNVPLNAVNKGDLVEVVPGERIPLDGEVIDGRSEVDESLITGESKPVGKKAGDEVIGGSVNLHGSLIFRVKRTGSETLLSGIIRAVEEAQAGKPRIQGIADTVVGYFVPFIIIIATGTILYYLMSGNSLQVALMTGISVLVIACPCSLGLATPLAVLLCTTAASAKGLLMRSGEVIENMSKVNHIVFDKTGTITRGKPELKEIILLDNSCDKDNVLALAAAIENKSEHSLSSAIVKAANVLPNYYDQIHVEEFKAIPGEGVEAFADGRKVVIGNWNLMHKAGMILSPGTAENSDIKCFESSGDTVIYMGWSGFVRAALIVSDMPREEASGVVSRLQSAGYSVSIASGDNKFTTEAVASVVGISHIVSEASPLYKKEIIAKMQASGNSIMLIGDGINDAPALTEALVGVAMGKGTDIAMESADAVLVRNDLKIIPSCLQLSKKSFFIIRQNIFWAFFYNICAIPLAIAGLLHPIMAAAAMAASSLFVVSNSLRIRKG